MSTRGAKGASKAQAAPLGSGEENPTRGDDLKIASSKSTLDDAPHMTYPSIHLSIYPASSP